MQTKKPFLFLLVLLFIPLVINAEERYITTSDGVSLYVDVKGDGPACLYIHGGPGSGSYWLEEFYGEFLESNFRMIYLDQRVVGRSSSPANNDYSMERMAKEPL